MLGRGGMAEAFLARRAGQPEPFVLKRIRPDFADSDAYLRRFVLEAQIASRLAHRNLARFEEFGRIGDCHYLVMKQVRGHSLHRLLEAAFASNRPLPPAAALHLGGRLLDGLSAMHRVRDDDGHPRPMLHRDVTPSNVIVDLDGEPVLIDFGIAKDINGPSITLPGQVIGTARYMAPEHRRAEYIDARADVFAASVVLFELFVGRHPWPPLAGMRELLRTTFDPPEIPRELQESLHGGVLEVILGGLGCAPDDRWADAEEMRSALVAAAAAEGLSPEDGADEVRGWVQKLGLARDEELTSPVIDHLAPEGEDAEVMWSAAGSVARDASHADAPADGLESSVLTIPPLPPRRDEGIDLGEAHLAAFGSPLARYLPIALAGLIACAAGAWLVHAL
jgi:serine/threonine protein kinase